MSEVDANISPLNYESRWRVTSALVRKDPNGKYYMSFVNPSEAASEIASFITNGNPSASWPQGCYYLQAGNQFQFRDQAKAASVGSLNVRGNVTIRLTVKAIRVDNSGGNIVISPSDFNATIISPLHFAVLAPTSFSVFMPNSLGNSVSISSTVYRDQGIVSTLFTDEMIPAGTRVYGSSEIYEYTIPETYINGGIIFGLFGGEFDALYQNTPHGSLITVEVIARTASSGVIQGDNFITAGYNLSAVGPHRALNNAGSRFNQFALHIPAEDNIVMGAENAEGRSTIKPYVVEQIPNTGNTQEQAQIDHGQVIDPNYGDKYEPYFPL